MYRFKNLGKKLFAGASLAAVGATNALAEYTPPVKSDDLWNIIDLSGVELKMLAAYGLGLSMTLGTIIFLLVKRTSKRAARA